MDAFFLTANIVPYFRSGFIALFRAISGSTSPNIISKCSPSPSSSQLVKIRTGVLRIRTSVMPAHVFLRLVVNGELITKAVTLEIESQQVELMPRKQPVRCCNDNVEKISDGRMYLMSNCENPIPSSLSNFHNRIVNQRNLISERCSAYPKQQVFFVYLFLVANSQVVSLTENQNIKFQHTAHQT